MKSNQGYDVEFYMRAWFKGEPHPRDCVDFTTKSSLYEVKSCELFNSCNHTKQKRVTFQLGRFVIKKENHDELLEVSKREKKIPKYIFVIVIENRKIWKTLSWREVDKLLKSSGLNRVVIKDIFGGRF